MATATATIHAFVTLETAHAHAYGDALDVAKAEIDALNELIKRSPARLFTKVSRGVRDRTVNAVDVAYEEQRGPHTRKDTMETRTTHLGRYGPNEKIWRIIFAGKVVRRSYVQRGMGYLWSTCGPMKLGPDDFILPCI